MIRQILSVTVNVFIDENGDSTTQTLSECMTDNWREGYHAMKSARNALDQEMQEAGTCKALKRYDSSTTQ